MNAMLRLWRRTAHNSCRRANCRALSTPSTPAAAEFSCDVLTGDRAGIVVLTMAREGARNALGVAMMSQFAATMQALRFDPAVRVVILRSVVPRVFCAGADLKERSMMAPREVAAFVHGLRAGFTALSQLPMPTIAAIEGAALGGGAELALSCDFRVAGEDATFGFPETGLAIIPGAGGTQRLPRLIGAARAKELIFTARKLSAASAERYGLLTSLVPAGQAYAAAEALAKEILPRGPLAVRASKEAIDAGTETDLATGLAIESACYAQIIPTADRLEGLAAFREKREPKYSGR